MFGGHLHQIFLAVEVGVRLKRLDSAASKRLAFIGDDQPGIDANDATKSFAGLAGADGRVKRKQGWSRFAKTDIAVRTDELACEVMRLLAHLDPTTAVAIAKCCFYCFIDSAGGSICPQHEAILNDKEGVFRA